MKRKYKESYLSIDVEADGPIPGRNNMLSFGAALFSLNDEGPPKPVDTFEANLDLLPEATPSADTMAFWAKNPEAWAACRKNTRPAAEVMPEFIAWLRKWQSPVIVGFPVTYDHTFLYWYTRAFGGLKDGERSPMGFQGLDIKTLAMDLLGCDFKKAYKQNMPKRWFKGAPKHNHEALTDAIGQGVMFVNMMRELEARRD